MLHAKLIGTRGSIYTVLSRSSAAAAAVTNAVVTSASKRSGNPLCRREIGRKKLAVHKRSGSHGWIPRWQYSQRGCREFPFWRIYSRLLLSLSFSLARSLLCKSPSFFPFFFYFALFYERRYRHLVFDYREGTRAKDEEEPANTLPSRFY